MKMDEEKKVVKAGITCDKGDILTLLTSKIDRVPFNAEMHKCNLCDEEKHTDF